MTYVLIEPGKNSIEQIFIAHSQPSLGEIIKRVYQEELDNCKTTADIKEWQNLRDGVLRMLRKNESWTPGKHILTLSPGRDFILLVTNMAYGYIYE